LPSGGKESEVPGTKKEGKKGPRKKAALQIESIVFGRGKKTSIVGSRNGGQRDKKNWGGWKRGGDIRNEAHANRRNQGRIYITLTLNFWDWGYKKERPWGAANDLKLPGCKRNEQK